MRAINLIRNVILQRMDLSGVRQYIIDSLPIPVMEFHLVPASTGDSKAYDATFGKVLAKEQTIFGYHLHLLFPMNGLILNFELTATKTSDLEVVFELLSKHTDLVVRGNKG